MASNSRANIIIVADEEQLDKVMQVVEVLVDHQYCDFICCYYAKIKTKVMWVMEIVLMIQYVDFKCSKKMFSIVASMGKSKSESK